MNLYGQSCPEHSGKGSSVLDEDSIGNIAKQKLGAYFIQQPTRMRIEAQNHAKAYVTRAINRNRP